VLKAHFANVGRKRCKCSGNSAHIVSYEYNVVLDLDLARSRSSISR